MNRRAEHPPFGLLACVFLIGWALTFTVLPASSRGQSPEEALLTLESIKLEMERIQQETSRLSLQTRTEIQYELELLRQEMERAKREFEQELIRFRQSVLENRFDSAEIVAKFKQTVDQLYREIREQLKIQQAELRKQQAEIRAVSAELPGAELLPGAEQLPGSELLPGRQTAPPAGSPPLRAPQARVLKKKPVPGKPQRSPKAPRAIRSASVKVPRIRTLSPDQPLALEAVERRAPEAGSLERSYYGGIAPGRSPEFRGDAQVRGQAPAGTVFPGSAGKKAPEVTYEPKLYNIPRPGRPPHPEFSELDRHLQALGRYSEKIQAVKARLRSRPADPRPLWLDLGEAYLGSGRYLKSMPAETSRRVLKSDLVSGLVLGGFQAALFAFKTALWLNPEDPDTTITISRIYDTLEDGQNAVNYLERARALYEKNRQLTQARAAVIKRQALIRKYPEIWQCPGGAAESCEQHAGRRTVGEGLFQGNLRFYQAGIPPAPVR